MGKREPVPNRQYTGEFRLEAVRLAGSIGGNAAAKRLGIPQSTMTNWVRCQWRTRLPSELQAVALALNTRPRKTLGWRTPAEALNKVLLSAIRNGVATIG